MCQSSPSLLGGGLLLLLRDNAQLSQHAQLVDVAPVLDHLAVSNAQDVYPRNRYLIAGGSNAYELALMSATNPQTSYHLISLGDHVFYVHLKVGEGSMHRGDELLEALKARA